MQKNRFLDLSADEFESFVTSLIRAMDYHEVSRISGTNDRGVDIVAYRPSEVPGTRARDRKLIFQCKRTKRVRRLDIEQELAHFAPEIIDTWILVVTVNPSAELRRWFERLSKSNRYPFYIGAWWLDNLIEYTRQYGGILGRLLPDTISAKLKLSKKIDRRTDIGESEAERAIANLRYEVILQIERHARKKYIPSLYVERKIQAEIFDFLRPEGVQSNESRAEIIKRIRSASFQLEDYISRFKRTSKLQDPKRTESPRGAEDPFRDQNFTARLGKKSAEWMRELKAKLQSAIEAAEGLPVDQYFDARKKYEDCGRLLTDIISHLENMPTEHFRAESDREEAVGILSNKGFHLSLRSLVESTLAEVRMVHKHALFVIDRAGSGKTNLICNIAQEYSQNSFVVLLFGKEHVQGASGLIDYIESSVAKVLSRKDGLTQIDAYLAKKGTFLIAFIDGINENRKIAELESSLSVFFDWARSHRIKVIITCRDIYWDFFDSSSWEHQIRQVYHNKLDWFSKQEYNIALSLYLSHYNLDVELKGEARDACAHPLLLRFFCEAYGSVDGGVVGLGAVDNIRLKELFDVYLERKSEQLRIALNHYNTDLVLRYLTSIVQFMFNSSKSSMLSVEVEEATGDPDTSTASSLYLRLLDEDIVIEERPAGALAVRRISFVYEEFMEYFFARCLLRSPERFHVAGAADIFVLLKKALKRWVNARGVGEYIGLMLACDDFGYSRDEIVAFFGAMLCGGKVWKEAFWSIVAKLPTDDVQPCVYDALPVALGASKRLAQLKIPFEIAWCD